MRARRTEQDRAAGSTPRGAHSPAPCSSPAKGAACARGRPNPTPLSDATGGTPSGELFFGSISSKPANSIIISRPETTGLQSCCIVLMPRASRHAHCAAMSRLWRHLCRTGSPERRPERRAVLRLRKAAAGSAGPVSPALGRARSAGVRSSGGLSYAERHLRYRGSPRPSASGTASARIRRAAATKVCSCVCGHTLKNATTALTQLCLDGVAIKPHQVMVAVRGVYAN